MFKICLIYALDVHTLDVPQMCLKLKLKCNVLRIEYKVIKSNPKRIECILSNFTDYLSCDVNIKTHDNTAYLKNNISLGV